MTRIEYELLAEERPDLALASWYLLTLLQVQEERLKHHTRETLIAARTAQILSGSIDPFSYRRISAE